ncbi:flagellar basal-body rod modification protein FlgD [Shimia gijangensis]|uniref:Basal-body rod modification protein FlgD n=1 Tax=Shimia gijangensis TaxID=1470563 RepID=A0A1M6QL67_9RHOB|nr:flagellar hook capping FlgD N-terminal domain-containing protein [Shimia gijangensis]SHK20757.1 flagellar basal-body rod modification protein FlgD [Shimia gijangensis]
MEIAASNHQVSQPVTSQASSTSLSSDYETFLKMLTVQMNNQDPLDPVDSADYAVQLATFASVEQQVMTNDLLTAVQAQLTTMGITQLAGWVGMDAQAMAPGQFDGEPVEVATYPDSLADQVELVVHDENGTEVYRQAIEVGQQNIQWGGIANDGTVLPEGLYSFSTESYADGLSLGEQPADVYSRIIEARAANGGIVLVLEGGAIVNSSEIAALRNPA